jgi:hypothetical protein
MRQNERWGREGKVFCGGAVASLDCGSLLPIFRETACCPRTGGRGKFDRREKPRLWGELKTRGPLASYRIQKKGHPATPKNHWVSLCLAVKLNGKLGEPGGFFHYSTL